MIRKTALGRPVSAMQQVRAPVAQTVQLDQPLNRGPNPVADVVAVAPQPTMPPQQSQGRTQPVISMSMTMNLNP